MMRLWRDCTCTAIFLGFELMLAPAHGSSPEPVAEGQQETAVTETANGTPMVQIDDPNDQGLSQNLYNRFDVAEDGLILNNSREVTNTEQAGHIAANPNLKNGSAEVILNEVVRSNPSSLRGYMEVGGPAADVVVANPNGITCDGCGFINTNRATLTTGQPELHNGMLDAFSVSRGRISFAGEGLNAGNVDSFDVIARSVELNAELRGQNIHMATGAQDVGYSDLSISDVRNPKQNPSFAISSSALGGIYGDRIEIIANEDGVGVNLDAPVAAQTGDLVVNAEGRLMYDRVSAAGDMSLSAEEMTAGADMTVGDTLDLDGERVFLPEGKASATNINVQAPVLDLGEDAALAADNRLEMDLSSLENQGILTSSGMLDLSVDDFSYQGDIQGDESVNVNAKGNIRIPADSTWKVNGDMDLVSGGQTVNKGRISSAGTLNLAPAELNNDGDMAGRQGLYVEADSVTNGDRSLLLSGTDMTFRADTLTNRGDIYSINRIDIGAQAGQAKEVRNTSGRIATGQGSITVSAEKLINQRAGEPEVEFSEGAHYNEFRDKNGRSAERHQECFKQSRGGNGCQGFTAFRYTVNPQKASVIETTRPGRIYSGADMEFKGDMVRNAFSNLGAAGDMDFDVERLENMSFTAEVTDRVRIDQSWHEEEDNDFHSDTDITATTLSPDRESRFCGSSRTYCHTIFLTWPDHEVLEGVDFQQNSPDSLYNSPFSEEEVWLATIEVCEQNQYGYGETCNEENRLLEERPVGDEFVAVQRASRLTWEAGGQLLVDSYWETNKPWRSSEKRTEELIPGLIEAGGDIAITGQEVNNGISRINQNTSVSFGNALEELAGQAGGDEGNVYRKSSFLGEDFRLPGDHGLFVVNEDPDHPYLIETNPLFADRDEFMGSRYMLDNLGWAPENTTRLLGDGFYELQHLREKLQGTSQSLTGLDYEEQKEQYRELMDNGLYAAEELEVSPGVELTAEQVNTLGEDLVWLEEKEVAGETVMAPVVYFAGGSEVKRQKSAIVGENVDIEGERVGNSGRIQAREDVSVTSTEQDIRNQGVVRAGDDVDMDSAGDIRNSSGTVQGDNVRMRADGDIVNERVAEEHGGSGGRFTALGDRARIQGDGRVELEAGGDIRFAGSELEGKDVGMSAEGDIDIATVEVNSGVNTTSGQQVTTSSTRHLASSIRSTLDLMVEAEDNISVVASGMAAGEDLKMDAGGELAIVSAQDRDKHESHTDLTDGHRSNVYNSVRQRSSDLVAGDNLTMNSGGDLTMVSSNATAGGDLALKAEGDMNLLSANDSSYSRNVTVDEGLFKTETRTSERYNEEVVSTSLNAGNNLLVNAEAGGKGIDTWNQAEGDVTLEGVQAGAGGEIFGYAGGDMNVFAAQSDSYEHNETRRSYSGLAVGLAGAGAVAMEAAMPGSSLGVDMDLKGNESRGHGETQLTATSMDSGSGTTLLAGGDANIVAGDLDTGTAKEGQLNSNDLGLGDLSVEAGLDDDSEGRVRIMGARENEYSYSRESSTELGTDFGGGKMSFARQETSSRRTEKADWVGSQLESSGELTVEGTGDVQIVGSELDSGDDLNVESGGDIHVLTGSDISRTRSSQSTSEFKVEGTTRGSSAELFAGYEKDRHVETTEKRTSVASKLTGKNVSLDSGRDINVAGSDLAAMGNRTEEGLEGGNLELDAERYLNTREGISEQSQTVIDENFRTGISVTAQENVSSASRSVRNVGDATNNVNRVSNALRAVDSVSAARSGAVTSSAGVVAEWSRSERTSSSEQARVTTLTAANNMTLKSGDDQNHSGTAAFAANNLNVDSGGKVNLSSAQNRRGISSSRENASMNIGLSGKGPSITAAGGQAESSVESVEHINAAFIAGNTASIESEGDTSLAGAVVQGRNIETDIEGDLNIESRQDTRSVDADSVQGSLTVGPAGPSSASLSVSETEGDKAWTNQQSGLFAADRADVTVEEHTQLNGGAIYSESGNMTLDTGTFDYNNIRGHDDQTTTSVGLGLSVPQGQTEGALGTARGQSLIPGAEINNLSIGYQNSEIDRVTRATLGEGEVIIRDEQDGGASSLAGINRDIDDAQEITDRDEDNYNLYASDSSLRNTGVLDNNDKEGDGSRLAALANTLDYQDAVDDMGDSAKEGIMGLDDSLIAGMTVGARKESEVLERTLNNNPLGGLVPSDVKNGGLLGQVDVLLGNKDKLHEERVVVNEGIQLFEKNREKFIRIDKTEGYANFSEGKKEKLEGFYISKRDAEFSEHQYTKFNFTNGMNNSIYDAVVNGKEQTKAGSFTVNYNPSYGMVSDFLESTQDMVFGAWLGSVPGVGQLSASFLTSGVSEQTANFVKGRISANNNQDYTLANHSQGNILLTAGLNSGVAIKEGSERRVKVTSYGSPVNFDILENASRDSGITLVGMKANRDDFIAEGIGLNYGDFNAKTGEKRENLSLQKWFDSAYKIGKTFNKKWPRNKTQGDPVHATYECIASCGDLK